MALTPYESFRDWEVDMERLRQNSNDIKLFEHVKNRFDVSSAEVKEQVQSYLQGVQFENNPVGVGAQLAKKYRKILVVKTKQDPWWDV